MRTLLSLFACAAMLEGKLDFLHEQLKGSGLKEQYYPRGPIPSGPNLLQLDMYQNTMPNFGAPAP